jgi:transposase-like protein
MTNTYTEDDRKEALKLAEEIGVTNASQRLGISVKTLYEWRHKATQSREPVNKSGEPMTAEELKTENNRLANENSKLKQEVDVLQEALSFFVERRKR